MGHVNYADDIGVDSLHADIESYEDGQYRVEYDSVSDDPVLAIVNTVSEITRTDPSELEPLYTAIETDALDHVFSTTGRDSQFSFHYVNFEIIIDNAGTIVCKHLPE